MHFEGKEFLGPGKAATDVAGFEHQRKPGRASGLAASASLSSLDVAGSSRGPSTSPSAIFSLRTHSYKAHIRRAGWHHMCQLEPGPPSSSRQ